MSLEVRNYLNYVLLALGAFLLGCATALVPQLVDPSMPPINWRPVLAAGISAVVAAYGASYLPRGGHAALAAQVDHLEASDVPITHIVARDAGTKREATIETKHAEAALAGDKPMPVDHTAERRA